MIEALAAEGFDRLKDGCQDACRRYPNDPARQLVEAGLAYLEFAIEKPAIVQLMFGGVISLPESGADLKQHASVAFGSLVDIVKGGQDAELFRQGNPFDLTLTAWSTVYGLSLMIRTGLIPDRAGTKRQIKTLGKTVAAVLLSGMQKR